MSGRVTSRAVAERAGVSQSAVSRVFSGASASARTVEKVRKAAEELGYRPNVLARSLITGRSRIIGVVVAYLDNPFYPDALERLSRALQEEGYHSLVFIAPEGHNDTDRVIQQMLDHQVDGIIAASVGLGDELAARCKSAGIPVVLFNRGQPEANLPQVTSANHAGGRRVAEHLVAIGRQRIGHVAGWQGSSTGRDRTEGFLTGLSEAGIAPTGVVPGDYRRDKAAEVAEELVTQGADALFVGNDHMAFAVMDHLRFIMGWRVPEDVAIVGYDDVPMAAWAGYDLTTIRQPVGQMVEATVTALLAALDGATPGAQEINGPLIIRGSTGGAAHARI
ncbi:MAG: LacI family DNA-binding transcriptional regulator [Paracoccaceae bacterium]|nr:LacI family DNA-binding transcriptional regulator [Paracoccaceae bacterium]